MAKPITRGGIPTPVYNRMKSNQERRDKNLATVRQNASMRVQDWNAAVDKFSTRGGPPKPPDRRAPMKTGGVSGVRSGSVKSRITGPYK
jgi:hypothetical protein